MSQEEGKLNTFWDSIFKNEQLNNLFGLGNAVKPLSFL